jgi:transcriptional regulator with XRE-family HTH domain
MLVPHAAQNGSQEQVMVDQDRQRTLIGQRLNHLFAVMHKPDGRRYAMREVVEGINEAAGEQVISVQYLSHLRRGERNVPSYEKLKAIAQFFGVDVGYFSDELPTEEADEQAQIVQALRDAGVRSMALRSIGLSDASLDTVMALIDHLRSQEGLPPANEDQPGESGELASATDSPVVDNSRQRV